jgi:hypothetical protein
MLARILGIHGFAQVVAYVWFVALNAAVGVRCLRSLAG